MPLTIGLDIGTTSITALALDTETGGVAGRRTLVNDAQATPPADRARGRSEWDARAIVRRACEALAALAGGLGARRREVAGIGLTGQQHGVVLLDDCGEPVTPFINWQDRRGEEPVPGAGTSWAARAVLLTGPEAPRRAGCALATGFMGVTLYWLKETGAMPGNATACAITDYAGSVLTGAAPVTDPTNAASSGLLNLKTLQWDAPSIAALGLPPSLLPEIRQAGTPLGSLTPAAARSTGLAPGVPLFVGLGDNQASFIGSVAAREDTVLVNVGTGAQVAVWSDRVVHAPPLEARPFPEEGYLLVYAGLSGGRAYALLETFLRQVGEEVFGVAAAEPLYERMNVLAMAAPPGASGLRCDPCFAGTRAESGRRGGWTGISPENFTPAHLTRALLEGMARSLREGYEGMIQSGVRPRRLLVGAGNALRENPALAGIIAQEFALPLRVPAHREEAAFGACLVAARGTGIFPDLAAAGRLLSDVG